MYERLRPTLHRHQPPYNRAGGLRWVNVTASGKRRSSGIEAQGPLSNDAGVVAEREQGAVRSLGRGPLSVARAGHRKEIRNEHIFRFICLESAACTTVERFVQGCPAVTAAEDAFGRSVPARVALYARPRTQTPRKHACEGGREISISSQFLLLTIRPINVAVPSRQN
jgi:hypothetical protein